MSYSLSEAATACGVYKSTILRSIKAGRLTGTKDALGQWRIEPAELHRVYAPAQRNGADSNGARHGATAALVEAQHRAELVEERLTMLTLVLEDLRVQRDKWQQQAERLALTDARAQRPWWRRLAA
jgi:excisionase family DNA binding protein